MQVQQAVAAMQHKHLFAALEGWRANTAQAKALRCRLYQAIKMWMLRLLGSAFAGWKERTALTRTARELCAGVAEPFPLHRSFPSSLLCCCSM